MRTALLFLPVLAALGCRGTNVNIERDVTAAARAVPRATLQKLGQKRIYFGHQSVGYDIVEGLRAVASEQSDAGLRIVEARSPEALGAPAFAHARNGRNHEPLTKIRDFAETIEGGLGATTDIALFKFCYVDFPPGTDVEKVFAEYRSTLARLRDAFPAVRFVHVTSPLTVVQSGPKAYLKKLLGRPLGGAEANVVRERFNALLRKEYAGREPLFDLAAVEASRPDGETVSFEDGGARYPALADEYASDGKHLNPAGARWAAVHLLKTLAPLAD
jgi:hypothetical protein